MITRQEAETLRKLILRDICDAYNKGFDCYFGMAKGSIRAFTEGNSLSSLIGNEILSEITKEHNAVYETEVFDIEDDSFGFDKYLDELVVDDEPKTKTA